MADFAPWTPPTRAAMQYSLSFTPAVMVSKVLENDTLATYTLLVAVVSTS